LLFVCVFCLTKPLEAMRCFFVLHVCKRSDAL
jgi:hypothetical protein